MPLKKGLKKIATTQAEMHHDPHEHHEGKHRDKKPQDKGKKHHEKKHHEEKDLRRAYEHLGRLSALETLLTGRTVTQIKLLTNLAEKRLLADDPKSAADLLRAAEHLAFGSLAQTTRATRLSEALEAALKAELEHLAEKAAERWKKHEDDRPAEVAEVYASMVAVAEASRVKGAYRRALEFARGADALAHVRGGQSQDTPMLDAEGALQLADEDE